jgi:hypothetical protein
MPKGIRNPQPIYGKYRSFRRGTVSGPVDLYASYIQSTEEGRPHRTIDDTPVKVVFSPGQQSVPEFSQPDIHRILYGPKQKSSCDHQTKKYEKLYAVTNQTVKGLIDRFTAFPLHRDVQTTSLQAAV